MRLRRVLAIVNSEGGTVRRGDLDAATLKRMFRDAGVDADVRFVPGDRVDATASEALRSKADAPDAPDAPDAIIAGGGDGTIRCVAAHLAAQHGDNPLPLGVLPLGTLNHFARDLGIPDELSEAVRLIASGGSVRALDVGEVNGKVFVNNSVLGFYPPVVQERDREREATDRNKWLAAISAAFKVLPRNPLLRMRIRAPGVDAERQTRFLFVGNNEYELSAFTYSARSRLESGNLYLYVARSRGRLGLIGLFFLGLVRDLKATAYVDCWTLPELSIEMRDRSIPVYLDGEVFVLQTPLQYRTRPRALRVILPPESGA